jgi:hypothetical protein
VRYSAAGHHCLQLGRAGNPACDVVHHVRFRLTAKLQLYIEGVFMKAISAIALYFVTFFPLAASAGTDNANCPEVMVLSEKTRAEVRAELVEAERDGWISARKQRAYPPASERIGVNDKVYDAGVGTTPDYQASNQQP